jgi:hypothetical protein
MTIKTKHPGGRPRKTIEDINAMVREYYKPHQDYKEFVQWEMSEGASLTEIKAALHLWNDSFERFMKEDEEFRETIKKGIFYSEAWWLKQGLHEHEESFRMSRQTRD